MNTYFYLNRTKIAGMREFFSEIGSYTEVAGKCVVSWLKNAMIRGTARERGRGTVENDNGPKVTASFTWRCPMHV